MTRPMGRLIMDSTSTDKSPSPNELLITIRSGSSASDQNTIVHINNTVLLDDKLAPQNGHENLDLSIRQGIGFVQTGQELLTRHLTWS